VACAEGHTDSVSWNLWPFRRKPLLHVATDSGRGAPVVLLHGIASSSVTFEYVIPQLTDRRRVVALDLLGFGRSTAPASTQFTIDEHVDAVARTLEHQNVATPFTLVGHSLGALISLRLAARFPKMVGHLVLVAPPVYLPSDTIADPVERVRMDAYLRLYDFMRKNRDFTTSAAQAMERISPIRNLFDVNESNWRAFSLSLEKCIESQTTVADIAQVRCAIDVIYGTLDPFLAPAGLRVIERMRGVATTRVEGVDHVIRPKLAKALVKVIDNPSPPTAPIKLVGRAR